MKLFFRNHAHNWPNAFPGFIPVKVNADNINETLSQIETKWNAFSSQAPFSYHFLDEELADMYRNEKLQENYLLDLPFWPS